MTPASAPRSPASPSSAFSFRKFRRRSASNASGAGPPSPTVSTFSNNTASDSLNPNAEHNENDHLNEDIAAKVAPELVHKPASSSKMSSSKISSSAGAELDLDDDQIFHQAEMAVIRQVPLNRKRRNVSSSAPGISEKTADRDNGDSSLNSNNQKNIVTINGNVEQFHRLARKQVFVTLTLVAAIVYAFVSLAIPWPFVIVVVGIVMLFLHNNLRALKDDFAFTVEHQLLKHYGDKLDGESVGWVNNVIESMWTQINPDIFIPIVDLLEDTMQYIAPSTIVQSVRIEGFSLGTNPFHILSIRTSPSPGSSSTSTADGGTSGGQNTFDMEVAFSYRRAAPTGKHTDVSQSNVHFLVYLGAGIGKLVGLTIPCYVELRGVVGKLYLRVETSPDPPFLRNATFSFPSKPTIHVVAKPLSTLDVMNLPLISSYVLSSINTVLSYFVEPKSYTIDLTRLLLGSNMIYKTHHTGIIYIFIGRGFDLLVSDVNGKSDPYVSICYAKFEKPLYCTRIIKRDLNPFWMESCFIKVAPEHMTENEKVRLMVWDSDRYSADDTIGVVEQDVNELVNSPGIIFLRRDPLQARYRGMNAKGHISWAIGYFPLTSPSPAKPSSAEGKRSGSSEKNENKYRVPFFLKESEIFHEPPRDDAACAILAFQIHQLEGLEIPLTAGKKGKRLTTEEEGSSIPSSFCTCFLNDEKIFKTRTKACSSSPYINAGSEIFVKDWKNARFSLAALDSRMREHDAVIGVVNVKLVDLFRGKSEVTSWYPLENGIGFGNVRFSLLLRTVDIKLPRELNGPNVGVLEVHDIKVNSISGSKYTENVSMNVSCASGVSKSADRFIYEENKQSEKLPEWTWLNNDQEPEKHVSNRPLSIPIVKRYQHPVRFELRDGSGGISKLSRKLWMGEATLWLSSLVDNEEMTLRLPIQSTHWKSRRQNCWDVPTIFPSAIEDTYSILPDKELILGDDKHSKRRSSTSDALDSGVVEIKVKFVPGISLLHKSISTRHGKALRDAYKVFEWRNIISTASGDDAKEDVPPKIVTQHENPENIDNGNAKSLDTGGSSDWVTEMESPVMNNNSNLHSPRPSDISSSSRGPDNVSGGSACGGDGYVANEGSTGRLRQYMNKRKQQSLVKSKLHRGMYQMKTIRTLSWAKESTKAGIRRAAHSVSHKGRDPKTEEEVFSSF